MVVDLKTDNREGKKAQDSWRLPESEFVMYDEDEEEEGEFGADEGFEEEDEFADDDEDFLEDEEKLEGEEEFDDDDDDDL